MGLLNVRKVVRKNPVQIAVFRNPPPLTGSVFFYGKIGSGKTTALLSLAGKYHDNPSLRYKIFDLWGGRRNEQFYWCLPSIDKNYWDLVEKKLRLNKEGPKQYKVNLLYPLTKKIPDRLPSLEGFVFPQVFTIPFKDIEIVDIKMVLGNISAEGETLWNNVREKAKKTDGSAELIKIFKDLNGMNTSLYKNFVFPLINQRLLSSEVCEYNVDIKEEVKDREAITVLCLDKIDEKFKLFIMNFFNRKIAELLDAGKISSRIIPLIREANEFFRATERAVVEDRMKIFKTYLAHYIKMGRRGMHPFLDTQSPSETQGLVEDSQDFTILGKLPGETDRKYATDQLKRDGKITQKQIMDLGQLEPGQYYFVPSGKHARKIYLLLPRTMYWKEGYNFYTIWKNLKNEWKSFKKFKLDIEEDFKASSQKIIDDEKLKQLMRKQEKEEREVKTKERKEEEFEESERRKQFTKKKIREEMKTVKVEKKQEKAKGENNLNEEELTPIEEMIL